MDFFVLIVLPASARNRFCRLEPWPSTADCPALAGIGVSVHWRMAIIGQGSTLAWHAQQQLPRVDETLGSGRVWLCSP